MKKFLATMKSKAMLAAPAVVGAATTVTAFAAETGDAGGSTLPTLSLTTDMLTPLVEGVIANLGVVLPVGLGLYSVFLGIRIIPNLINRFTRA